jgi:calcium-dependent protein kinase
MFLKVAGPERDLEPLGHKERHCKRGTCLELCADDRNSSHSPKVRFQSTIRFIRATGHSQQARLIYSKILALKTILKSKVPDTEVLKREIEIMRTVNHPHIIRLYDVFENEHNIFLVTELCTGGELYDRVVDKTLSEEEHFSEYDAARITRNILSALEYIHSIGVAHRDLKPENFLLEDETDESAVKIIDFGLSRFHDDNNGMKSRVGTIYYVAPEVLCKLQWWIVGMIQ